MKFYCIPKIKIIACVSPLLVSFSSSAILSTKKTKIQEDLRFLFIIIRLLRIYSWSVNREPPEVGAEARKHNIYSGAESMKNSRNIYPAFAWFATPDRTSRSRWRHGETKCASILPRLKARVSLLISGAPHTHTHFGTDQSCNFPHCSPSV